MMVMDADHLHLAAHWTVKTLGFPLIVGTGTWAIDKGNTVVLIGAVVMATGVILRTARSGLKKATSWAHKIDSTWEYAQKIPSLIEKVESLEASQTELDQIVKTHLPRNAALRTRATDGPEDMTS